MVSEQSESATKHIDQRAPIEWHDFSADDGRTLIARDTPEGTVQLYVVSAVSRNVRTFAKADAALYEGNVVWTYYDEETRMVEFIHDYAGSLGEHFVEDWLDEPAVRLKKLPSGSGNLTEAIA